MLNPFLPLTFVFGVIGILKREKRVLGKAILQVSYKIKLWGGTWMDEMGRQMPIHGKWCKGFVKYNASHYPQSKSMFASWPPLAIIIKGEGIIKLVWLRTETANFKSQEVRIYIQRVTSADALLQLMSTKLSLKFAWFGCHFISHSWAQLWATKITQLDSVFGS